MYSIEKPFVFQASKNVLELLVRTKNSTERTTLLRQRVI